MKASAAATLLALAVLPAAAASSPPLSAGFRCLDGCPGAAAVAETPSFTPWMCLERCPGGNITGSLGALQAHSALLQRGVSFERFNLGADGALVDHGGEGGNLTDVTTFFRRQGIKMRPMVSSYPYPPPILGWMRELWKPGGEAGPRFLAALVDAAERYGFAGYNIDMEPAVGVPTAEDARDYSRWLSVAADALHAHGLELTVDFAGWSALWNWELLAATRVDECVIMNYATHLDTFESTLKNATAAFGPGREGLARLAVGVATTTDEAGARARFKLLRQYGVKSVHCWTTPLQDWWWPLVEAFEQGDPL